MRSARKLLDGAETRLGDFAAFSDADFAGCTVSLKSTSGSILYYRGVPLVWKSQRQSIRSLSTCEAEFVALFDTIKLTQSQGFLDWLSEEDESRLPVHFCDNQAALAV